MPDQMNRPGVSVEPIAHDDPRVDPLARLILAAEGKGWPDHGRVRAAYRLRARALLADRAALSALDLVDLRANPSASPDEVIRFLVDAGRPEADATWRPVVTNLGETPCPRREAAREVLIGTALRYAAAVIERDTIEPGGNEPEDARAWSASMARNAKELDAARAALVNAARPFLSEEAGPKPFEPPAWARNGYDSPGAFQRANPCLDPVTGKPIKVHRGDLDCLSFEDAFRTARASKADEFHWRGGRYTTRTVEEERSRPGPGNEQGDKP